MRMKLCKTIAGVLLLLGSEVCVPNTRLSIRIQTFLKGIVPLLLRGNEVYCIVL